MSDETLVPPFDTGRTPERSLTEIEEVPTRVPVEFAYTYWLVRPARVVEPVLEMEKSVVVAEAVEEPIAKSVCAVSPLLVWIESLAYGEVEPTPKEPEVGSWRIEAVVVAGSVPKRRLPIFN